MNYLPLLHEFTLSDYTHSQSVSGWAGCVGAHLELAKHPFALDSRTNRAHEIEFDNSKQTLIKAQLEGGGLSCLDTESRQFVLFWLVEEFLRISARI